MQSPIPYQIECSKEQITVSIISEHDLLAISFHYHMRNSRPTCDFQILPLRLNLTYFLQPYFHHPLHINSPSSPQAESINGQFVKIREQKLKHQFFGNIALGPSNRSNPRFKTSIL
ncbi:hypothetical protein KFK09_002748 [Dendrobium nobile]|uniref:Uncharacterized protein n=1 Tax=Dendrobium nobile TaxID=94219 RepID=A0A8T3C772_DENNO|nr:hypothetical protein KFK09_002748 [Dendrobium nobile]